MDKPIINSLLDLDKYKLTMCQIVHDYHHTVNVKYEFNNRTRNIKLAEYIDIGELKEQIQHIKTLRFNYDELTYLKNQPEFNPDFINFLATMNPNVDFDIDIHECTFGLSNINKQLSISFKDKWEVAILYETLILSLINEMFGKRIMNGLSNDCINTLNIERKDKLIYKLNKLKDFPEIKFIEFGTRRRHSFKWQMQVIQHCIDNAPNNLIGTSNYWMAKEFGIKPIGTQAHEWFMVNTALHQRADGLPKREIQKECIEEWVEYYGTPLSIILTDTFGTDSFLQDFDKELSQDCIGVRHDSGDPIKFGYTMINHYKKYGIDPKDKTIVFSDGLDENMILKLFNEFNNKIGLSFGWGTNLTNDVGIKPLSIVIKATEANGYGTVKLSDNSNKATGDECDVYKYKSVFMPNQITQETVY